jgi:glucose dehydrogenase
VGLCLGGLAPATAAAGATPAGFGWGGNWPQYRYSLNHQGFNPYEWVLGRYDVAHLGRVWSYTAGGAVASSPAVAGGVVYVDSFDGNLYALNAFTGQELWSDATGGGYSSPAVVGGVVYVGSSDDDVYALNAATGAELWSYTTGSYVSSSPAVAGGMVYVGSYDDNLYAFGLGGAAAPGHQGGRAHSGYRLPEQRGAWSAIAAGRAAGTAR